MNLSLSAAPEMEIIPTQEAASVRLAKYHFLCYINVRRHQWLREFW